MTWGMRSAGAMAAAFGLFSLVNGAQAAGLPMVAGKYAAMGWHICQTVIHTPKKNFKTSNNGTADAVTSVELDWNAGSGSGNPAGILSMTVNTVTFPATPSSSGNASSSGVEIIGHSMRDDNPANTNSSFERHVLTNQPVSFEFTTATTLEIGGTEIFDVRVGDIDKNGVARTIHMLRRPKANDYCMDSMTLTHQ